MKTASVHSLENHNRNQDVTKHTNRQHACQQHRPEPVEPGHCDRVVRVLDAPETVEPGHCDRVVKVLDAPETVEPGA